MRIPKRFLVVPVAVALLAAGCGGGSDDAGGGKGQNDPSGARTITVAAPGIASSLDAARYEGFVSIDLLPNLSGMLVNFTKPDDPAKLQTPDQIEPGLAESWEASEDGKEVTFKLRQGVTSNLGNPLDADDVKWSMDRVRQEEGVPIGSILMDIGGWSDDPIEVVDDSTFVLHLDAPNAVSVSILSTFFLVIYDQEAVEANAGADDPWGLDYLATNTASFGPYVATDFDPGKEVRLDPNPNYYLGAPKHPVLVRSVDEGSSRLQLVQTGEIDIATSLTFDQLASLQGDDRVKLEQILYPNIDVLQPNVTIEPFDDVRVRQAMAYAIDRDALLEGAYQGFGTPSTDFIHDAFGVETASEPIETNLDKARSLLADAGYEDGFDFTVTYNVANLGAHIEQVAVLLKSQLAAVGIDMELQAMPTAAEFDTAKREGTLEAYLATSLPLVPDPAYYLQVFYSTGGLTNLSGYTNPELDDLSREILETQPGAERDELVAEVDELMVADMPGIPLVDTQKFYAFNPSVTGFVSYPQGTIPFAELSAS